MLMNLCVEANLLAITVLGVNRVDENSMGWVVYYLIVLIRTIVLYLKQFKYLKTLKLLRFWFFITSFSTLWILESSQLKDSIHTFDPPLNCTNLGWQASLLLGHFLLGPWRLSGCKPPSFRPIRSIILFRPISQDVAAHSIMKKGASWNST